MVAIEATVGEVRARADDLARRGFVKKLGPVRSTIQWFKWLANSPV